MEQRRDGKMARNNRKQTFIICKNCGKSFHPISGHLKQETCGYDCAIALRVVRGATKKGKHYPHLFRARVGNCLTCGKEYRAVADFSDREQRYCSHLCYMKSRHETKPEEIMRIYLTKMGLDFEQEKRIGRYYADFYLPKENKVIECDGTYWHRDRQEKDNLKTNWLISQGYLVERIPEDVIRKRYAKFINSEDWESTTPKIL